MSTSPEAKQAAFDEFVAKQDKNHPQWDKCAASVTSYRAIAACFFDAGCDAATAKLREANVQLRDALQRTKAELAIARIDQRGKFADALRAIRDYGPTDAHDLKVMAGEALIADGRQRR